MSTESLKSRSAETKHEFAVHDIDHETVEKYRPEFLQAGFEHVVFTIPEHPSVVIKVRIDSIESCVNHLGSGMSLAEYEESLPRSVVHMQSAREKHEELRTYFGNDSVLAQRYIWFRAPLAPALRARLSLDEHTEVPEIAVVGLVQERLYGLEDRERSHSLQSSVLAPGVPYDNPLFNDAVVSPHSLTLDLHTLKDYLDPSLVARIEEDVEAQKVVRGFIERAIIYSNETQRSLDLGGEHNAVLLRTDTGWVVKLPDALYPGRQPTLSLVAELYSAYCEGKEIDWQIFAPRIVQTLSYVRYVNLLGAALGIPERIKICSEGVEEADFTAFARQALARWKALRNMS